MDLGQVEVLRWPAEASRRAALPDGVARLLLVAEDAAAPAVGPLEDWARVPVAADDLQRRTQRLAVLARRWAQPPALIDDVVLRHGDASTILCESEAAVASLLLSRLGELVSRATLEAALWPQGVPGERTLDSRVNRLRRRAAAVGLLLVTVRSQGFLLEVAGPEAGWW